MLDSGYERTSVTPIHEGMRGPLPEATLTESVWSNLVRFGWIRLDLVGFGQDLVVVASGRGPMIILRFLIYYYYYYYYY